MTTTEALHALLDRAPVASLATLEDGHPAVSLVPFVVRRGPLRLVVYVSELAPHTAALRADARCAVMAGDPPVADDARDNHALARVLFRATARFLPRDEARAAGLDDAWRARFPRVSEMILPLGDFHFVELAPVAGSASFVQGFGRAFRVEGDDFERVAHVAGR